MGTSVNIYIFVSRYGTHLVSFTNEMIVVSYKSSINTGCHHSSAVFTWYCTHRVFVTDRTFITDRTVQFFVKACHI